MIMFLGVRTTFPNGRVTEYTSCKEYRGTPEEWVAEDLAETGNGTKELFESDVPIRRTIWPDGSVTDLVEIESLRRKRRRERSRKHWDPGEVTE